MNALCRKQNDKTTTLLLLGPRQSNLRDREYRRRGLPGLLRDNNFNMKKPEGYRLARHQGPPPAGREIPAAGAGVLPQRQAVLPDLGPAPVAWSPVPIHCATTAIGSGEPGGPGFKLGHARPIPNIDDVAADFPRLNIVAAHPGWPWTEELIAVAIHKANVSIDISGWGPKYIPAALKHDMQRGCRTRCRSAPAIPAGAPAVLRRVGNGRLPAERGRETILPKCHPHPETGRRGRVCDRRSIGVTRA